MSYQITLSDKKGAKHSRKAVRSVGAARRRLIAALAANPDMTQSEIARELGVNKAVISRLLKGTDPMSMMRYAEIASILGRRMEVNLVDPLKALGQNSQAAAAVTVKATTVAGFAVNTDPLAKSSSASSSQASRSWRAGDSFLIVEAVS